MNEPPKFRYYKIEGEALEIVRAYKAELDMLIDDRQKLGTEFSERLRGLEGYHQSNMCSMWRRLSASVGLDPDKTWGSPEYQLETRYIGSGFGAILFVPRHTNPLQGMLGNEPMGQPSDPETDLPPDDITVH